jgi:hypothetical protein
MSWISPLLAAPKPNPFEVAGEYFNRPMGDRFVGGWWFAAVGAICFLWAAIYLVDRRRRQAEQDKLAPPTTLWDQLCQAHELTAEEEAMLRRLAGADEGEACKVFVDPRRWRSLPSQPADRLMLDLLQTRLFGALASLERAG